MTIVRKNSTLFIKSKPEIESAVNACLKVIDCDQNNDDPVNNPGLAVQPREIDAFNCVKRGIEKGVKHNRIHEAQFPHLRALGLFNTRGKIVCSAEDKNEIKLELENLQRLSL